MKNIKLILVLLLTSIIISYVGAKISAASGKILINRNSTVVSEETEAVPSTRGLQISRVGQNGVTAQSMIDHLKGQGITVSNVVYTGHVRAGGTFSGGNSAGLGIQNGILLSSGAVSNLAGPNNSAAKSTNNYLPGDSDLDLLAGEVTNDAAALEFDFVPQYNRISLQYLLASEEYPENVDYSDILAIIVDGVNIALLPGTTTPVSVVNINPLSNSQYYIDNQPEANDYTSPYTAPYDIQADGFTTPLIAVADVSPGVSHHIKIVIADYFDNVFDSWLLLKENSFYSACDLSINISNPATYTLGGLANYRLTARNVGVIAGQNVAVNFRLPFGSVIESLPAGISSNAGAYIWVIGSLAAGDSVYIDIPARIMVAPAMVGIANISTSTLDNDSTNNSNVAYSAPLAIADSYSTNEDTSLSVTIYNGLLRNDIAYSISPPIAEVVSTSGHGTLAVQGSGTFTYTPVANYNGTDSFSYRIYDGTNYSMAATVEITVNAVNDPPVLSFPAGFGTNEDTPLVINITQFTGDVDGDALSVTNVSGWTNGTWSFTAPNLRLVPNSNWNGSNSIIIRISDGIVNVNSPSVIITVNPVADISTDPENLSFGNVLIGNSGTIRLYIHNNGAATAQLSSPYLTSNNAKFAIGAVSGTTITAGGSVYADITYTPTQNQVDSGVLSIFNDVYGESPKVVALSGSGLSLPMIVVDQSEVNLSYDSGASYSEVLNISNTGEMTLEWSASLDPNPPTWLSLTPPAGNVNPGGSNQLTVQSALNGVVAGTYSSGITINSNSSINPQLHIPIAITVIGTPVLVTDSTAINFGKVYTGQSSPRAFVIRNTGTDVLTVGISSTNPQLSFSSVQISIPAFGSTSVNISLNSSVEGAFGGSFILQSNDPLRPSVSVPVSANVVKPPIIALSSYSITAMGVAEEALSKTVVVRNLGSEALMWQGMLQDNGDGVEWLNHSPAGGTILPGGQQTVTIYFNPNMLDPGARTAALLFNSNDIVNSTVPLNLTYIKQGYYYTEYDNNNNANTNVPDNDMNTTITFNSPLNPIEFNIYANIPEIYSARLVVKAYDVNDQSGEISKVFINGNYLGILHGAAAQYSNSLFDVNPLFVTAIGKNIISIEADVYESGNGIKVSSGQLILNNTILDAQIRYIQSDKSAYIAGETVNLSIEVDTQLASQSILAESKLVDAENGVLLSQRRALTIQAFGDDAFVESILLPELITAGTYYLETAVYDQSSNLLNDVMRIQITVMPNQPRIVLGALSLDFGILPSEIARTLYLTIGNTGNEPLVLSSLVGLEPGVTCQPGNLQLGVSETTEVAVTLQTSSVGSYQGALQISCNDPDAPVVNVEIIAEIIPNQAYLSVTPSTLDFGECFIGSQYHKSITITNLGPQNLEVSGITMVNPSYAVSETVFSLGYNQSREIGIDFSPLDPGDYNTNLQISSNAGNGESILLSILASAVLPPQISATPLQINASAVSGGYGTSNLEITNLGGSALDWAVDENFGKSLKVSGYSSTNPQYATIPNRGAIQLGGGAFTVSLWCKVESDLGGNSIGFTEAGGKQYLISKSANNFSGFFGIYTDGFDTQTTNKNLAVVMRNSTMTKELKFTNQLSLHQWYHVAVTYQSGTIKLYLNGQLLGSTTLTAFNGNTDPWIIGKYSSEASRYYRFDGEIDELRIYNVAKTQDYLQQTMYSRLSNQEPNLSGYWAFDAGNINDNTASNTHGTTSGNVSYPASGVTPMPTWFSVLPGFGTEAPNSGQNTEISLNATNLLAGLYTTTLILRSNDNLNPLLSIPVQFNVSGDPNVQITPAELDFGSVIFNTTKTINMQISNNGTANLNISGFSFSNGSFNCLQVPLTIPPLQTATLAVNFLPVHTGNFFGTLTLSTNIPAQPQIVLNLSGVGALPPIVNINPTSFDVALNFGETAQRSLQISNLQGLPLEYVLSVQESERSNAGGVYSGLDLHCKGMVWLQGKLYYLGYADHTLKKYNPATETVENSWQIHASPYSITTDGSSLFIASIEGRIYRYSASGSAMGSFMNPMGSFTPTITYADNALYISNAANTGSTIYKISLTGTMQAQFTSTLARSSQIAYVPSHSAFYALQSSLQRLVKFTFSGTSVSILDTLAIPMGLSYAFAHNGKDFYLLEDSKNYMTRHDDGIQELNWLSFSSGSGSVSSGQSQNVSLDFSARNVFDGYYSLSLKVATNDPVNSMITIPVHMNVSGTPSIGIAAQSIDFGAAYLGYPLSLPYIIENNGSATLLINNITTSSQFSCTETNLEILPWQSYELQIHYNPTTLGVHSGILSFNSSDPLYQVLNIALNGICLEAPNISISPMSITSSLMTDAAEEQNLVVSNNGITPLNYNLNISQSLIPVTRSGITGTVEPTRLIGDVSAQYPLFFHNMGAVVVDSDIYVVSLDTDELIKYSLPNVTEVQRYQIHDRPIGVSWDGTNLWIGSQGGILYRYNLSTLQSSSLNLPQNYFQTDTSGFMAFCFDGENLIVANSFSANAPTTFKRYNTAGSVLREYYSNITNISQLCYVPQYGNSSIWAYQNSVQDSVSIGGNILEIAFSGNQATIVSSKSFWDNGYAYTIAHDGNDFLISDINGPLQRVDDGRWLGSTKYKGTIASNSNVSIPIKLSPNGINGGNYNGNISFHSNDPDTPTLTIPVSLMVQGYPAITLTPTSAVYDTTLVGEFKTKIFTIRNTGSELLNVTSITSSNPAFGLGATALTIPAGGTRTLQITFQPTLSGLNIGTITVLSNATNTPALQLGLSGYGKTPTPEVVVSPTQYNYGSVYTNANSGRSFKIKNTGTATLVVNSITSPSGSFTTTTTLPFSVARGDSTTMMVVFAPAAATTYAETFVIHSNAGASPNYPLSLSGQGLTPYPHISVVPTTLNYGQPVTGVSVMKVLIITNQGQLPLLVTSISSTTPGFNIPSQAFTVQPGAERAIIVNFAAQAAGVFNGVLNIASNDPQFPTLPINFGGNAIQSYIGISTSPTSLAFGTVEIGSSRTLPLRITNTGNINLSISALMSSNPAYSVATQNATIAPDEFLDVNVVYSPQFAVAENGILNIINNSLSNPNLQLGLSGIGKHPVSYTVTPAYLDAYTNQVGTIIETITLHNTGLGTMQYTLVKSDPTDTWLSFSPSSGTITGGNSAVVTITMNTADLVYELYEGALLLQTNSTAQQLTTIPIFMTYANYNLTTHDNENNLGEGVADNDMDMLITNSALNAPIEFNIFTDASIVQNAQLKLSCQQVSATEVSRVYFNNQYLGNLTAPLTTIQDSYYNINPAWVNIGTEEKNTVRITLDETGADPTGTMVMLGKLDFNRPFANAAIVEMTAEPQIITPQSLLTVRQTLNTNLYTQNIRIESKLYDPNGLMVLTPLSRVISLTAYQNASTSAAWNLNNLLTPGAYYVIAKVYDNISNQLQATSRLDFEVRSNTAQIAVSPPALSFGNIFVGHAVSDTLLIRNLGAAPLVISSMHSSNAKFTLSATSRTIPAGGSYNLLVTALPSQLGSISGQLTITSNDPGTPTTNISLSATGVPAPQIQSPTLSIAMTMQQYSTATRDVTVNNIGGGTLQVSSSIVTGVPWISVTTGVQSITSGGSATLSLGFNSAGLNNGIYWADLVITSNDPLTPVFTIPIEVEVTGIPVIATFSASPLTGQAPLVVQFTSEAFTTDGSDIISWNWDFNNDGTVDSDLENPSYTYTTPGSYGVRLTVNSNSRASHSYLRSSYIYVVNNAPVIAAVIPDFFLTEDIPLTDFDLSSYFSDPDNGTLTYYISANEHLSFEINGNLLSIIPLPNYNGSENIEISASDASSATVSQSMWVHVAAVNDSPEFVNLPESFTYLRWTEYEVDMSSYIHDEDTDQELVTIAITGNLNTAYTIDQHLVTFSAPGDWFGSETVQISLNDNAGRSITTAS
ncbi:MAG: hypothetical protein CVU48_06835, partial [Candidatus Cloacimonetes bacterium HGW-Cloacimonetes-1]